MFLTIMDRYHLHRIPYTPFFYVFNSNITHPFFKKAIDNIQKNIYNIAQIEKISL